ncbi:1,4-dihydroxy-2-naphthoyl-CoA hydrolase [Sphingomonas sp. OV641]|uniref:hotdog fold thioesterase n=1 Tax=Sphingomonas sp. OV641 TaxID=1881068 RepID=UPI0008BA17DD|nr:hotdog fold thioesterase [Sphingomonas sp. OV641]SEJ06664.1 1,4-dihydroxy-2-naphthoyl-CoA hydrolase [Sphingomonas sp. OV641]
MAVWTRPIDLAQLTALGDGVLPGLLDIQFTEYGDDWIRARMPVGKKVHQPFGRLHGGASVVLAETVASVAGAMAVPEGKVTVGLDINANHVRAARDGYVYATAKAEQLGRTTQVWTIRIEDDAGKLICLSRMTAAVIDAASG